MPAKPGDHNYVWGRKRHTVMVTCTRCKVSSPEFDREAEWEKLVEWCNEHAVSKAA